MGWGWADRPVPITPTGAFMELVELFEPLIIVSAVGMSLLIIMHVIQGW